jgi:serine/threonine-protein kinase
MAPTDDALLSKVAATSPRVRTGDDVASHLLQRSVHRLQLVAGFLFLAELLTWVLVNLAQGTLASEFQSLYQWSPPVGVMAASALIVVIARSRRFTAQTVVRLGLIYQVVVSLGIAAGSYLGAFEGLSPADFTFDRIGITFVGPWMLFFSVLVPARPREALAALLLSATTVPVVYLIQVPGGHAPALPPTTFALVFVLPYLLGTAFSYVAARIVHQLGVEVRRAQELGSYRLETLLGRGGMGEVWRASHRMLARPAAIKLIRPDALGDDPHVAAARFEREAQAIASLESPHTVELYDFGTTEDGTLYYVMELLDGVDLEDLVRRFGPLPAERAVHVLRQACASLGEAHARGVVHRDVKPANIYLCRRALEHDVVKILDFGLAKRLASGTGPEAARLTRAELVAGTPAYLAPEVALGEGVVDGRADLYALGCVAFWLLTGRLVFDMRTPPALMIAHVRETPSPPSAHAEQPVPDALDRVVLDCLAKNPAARPQTAGALADRLGAVPLPEAWTPARAARWWETYRPH